MSESNGTAVAVVEEEKKPAAPPRTDLVIGSKGLQLTGLADLYRFAGFIARTPGFAPKGMESAESVCVAIQFGYEIGLSPMQALQSIAVINGRPGIFGDAAKALIESSGLMKDYKQWYEIDGKKLTTADGYSRTPTTTELKNDNCTACVLSHRQGRDEPLVHTFSIGDAKLAGLIGKSGPWTNYPSRMLMWRARGYNLRDNFGDVLKGLRLDDELADMAPAETVSTAAATVSGLRNRLAELSPVIKETASEIVRTNGETTPDAVIETKAASKPAEEKKPEAADKLNALIIEFTDKGGNWPAFLTEHNAQMEDIEGSKKGARSQWCDRLFQAIKALPEKAEK